MFLDFIDLHRLFYILGTLEGELVKKIFELIIFVIITYMVVSEYTRDPRRELRYLVAAFGALAFEKLVSTVVLVSVVFGKFGPTTYYYYFPIIGHILEIFALILLINAFLFPILIKKGKSLRNHISFQVILPLILYLFFQTSLIIEVLLFNQNKAFVTNHFSALVFTLIKIVLILYAIYMMSISTNIKIRYRYSAVIALLVYLIAPMLKLLNILFYGGYNQDLLVASHPFPLLAVLFFMRIMYLKLVDKAFLRKKLKISEKKYEHEKELGALKDKFVSIVSHELKTPLTSINLYSSLLRDGQLGEVNKKQKESISIIKDETLRLSNLITDILDLSKLEANKTKLKISEFDLHYFCTNNPSCYLAEQKGIKVINKVPKDFKIKVDENKFKQVLTNLFSNAAKYTDKQGKITLSAKSTRNKNIISIADTGQGIPKKDLEKIFDKFYQVEHHMTRKQGGTGLGLSIVHEIVKLHKGDIKVTSKVGKGTTFTITIPKDL